MKQEINDRRDKEGEVATREAMTHTVIVLTLLAMLGVIGFLAAGSVAQSATGTSGSVSLAKTKLGLILVNSKRHTLYMFAKDKNGKSSCSGSCAKFWPPALQAGRPTAGPGVKASLLGTTRRSNGSLQLTYNKHPLYSFVLDKTAGQTNGEGNLAFGAKWYAVSAKGTAVVKASPPPTTTTTTTTTPYPANPYP
jgi:predicted lipoprotein with Yx(FWY)xxD motif